MVIYENIVFFIFWTVSYEVEPFFGVHEDVILDFSDSKRLLLLGSLDLSPEEIFLISLRLFWTILKMLIYTYADIRYFII